MILLWQQKQTQMRGYIDKANQKVSQETFKP